MRDYVASLGVDLCFQDVDAELAGLPGDYAAPRGALIVVRGADGLLGMAAMRPLSARDAEMKRLFVRPAGRGMGLGRALALRIIALAQAAGYRRIMLDTLAQMTAAQALYRALGFAMVPPYYDNPLPGTVYMARDLGRE